MTPAELGRRCQVLRDAVGLTQEEAGARVGVDQSVISRIERGERRVDTLLLQKLADAYDFPPAAFFEAEPPRQPLALCLRQRGDLDTAAQEGLAWLVTLCQEFAFVTDLAEAS
jgi:transcriptional regulator with XRE-family HTH domain